MRINSKKFIYRQKTLKSSSTCHINVLKMLIFCEVTYIIWIDTCFTVHKRVYSFHTENKGVKV